MSESRGVPLVERVIELAGDKVPGHGLSNAELAALSLNGKSLPPSLRRWLEFDSGWAEFNFQPMKLRQAMGPAFEVFERILPGEFYSMRASASDCAWWFLYAGDADELGEYPVFLADVDDWYLVKIAYAGFDLFLADKLLGSYSDEAALKTQSLRNFSGYSWCELYGKALDIDGNETSWEGLDAPPSGDAF
ncbi:MAG TPA: hypothetical protein VEZ90_11760 [Blastocatellia bacterium]|nr:hypothetical protein [Blastocatellia bacterium]